MATVLGVFLILVGLLMVLLGCGILATFLLKQARDHEDQPDVDNEKHRDYINIGILSILPTFVLLVVAIILQFGCSKFPELNETENQLVHSLWVVIVTTYIINRGSCKQTSKTIPAISSLYLLILAGCATIDYGRRRYGYGYNYLNSAKVVGWEPIVEDSSSTTSNDGVDAYYYNNDDENNADNNDDGNNNNNNNNNNKNGNNYNNDAASRSLITLEFYFEVEDSKTTSSSVYSSSDSSSKKNKKNKYRRCTTTLELDCNEYNWRNGFDTDDGGSYVDWSGVQTYRKQQHPIETKIKYKNSSPWEYYYDDDDDGDNNNDRDEDDDDAVKQDPLTFTCEYGFDERAADYDSVGYPIADHVLANKYTCDATWYRYPLSEQNYFYNHPKETILKTAVLSALFGIVWGLWHLLRKRRSNKNNKNDDNDSKQEKLIDPEEGNQHQEQQQQDKTMTTTASAPATTAAIPVATTITPAAETPSDAPAGGGGDAPATTAKEADSNVNDNTNLPINDATAT